MPTLESPCGRPGCGPSPRFLTDLGKRKLSVIRYERTGTESHRFVTLLVTLPGRAYRKIKSGSLVYWETHDISLLRVRSEDNAYEPSISQAADHSR